jgi:DNA-binding PadR family transcriptional regulator
MKDNVLGQLELVVLMAVLRRGNKAYGLIIQNEIRETIGRKHSQGSIYNTLKRLEKKGMVSSKLGGKDADRLSRPRRYFTVSANGQAAVRSAQRDFDLMRVPGVTWH